MKHTAKISICVIGGGNIGTLLLADLSKNSNVVTMLYTSRPEAWKRNINVLSHNGEIDFVGKVDVVSNDPKLTIGEADIIISSLPTNALINAVDTINQHIKKGAMLGFIPGSGGKEFLFKKIVSKGHIIFGFQRVHAISRVNMYGDSVFNLGRKDELFFGSIPARASQKVCSIFEKLLNVKCTPLPNYLSVTLVPSNQILHTSRLYSMFGNYQNGDYWNNEILFYKEWNDDSSKVLLACDEELQSMLPKFGEIDTSYVKSLKTHYSVSDYEGMTKKIASIPAFSSIKAPMKKGSKGFVPDFESRYFTEDFPFGLCVIRSFAEILHHPTPHIDVLLKWFEKEFNLEFFVASSFSGISLKCLSIPQNYGIDTLEKIESFYK